MKTYGVKFGDKKTFRTWIVKYKNSTEAWVAYLASREINNPENVAIDYLGEV
jgi:hypothetical protein